MIKQRPLYCPNVILLDPMNDLQFPIDEAKSIIGKLSKETRIIVVYINHEFEDMDETQIVVKNFDYAIYKEVRINRDFYTSQLLGVGAEFVYYIKTNINNYRRAFVHFYDILSMEYPIVCISGYLSNHLQAKAVVVSDNILEIDRIESSNFLIAPVQLLSTSELLTREPIFWP